MADYIITLDDDQDASIGTPDYNIGVNYELSLIHISEPTRH